MVRVDPARLRAQLLERRNRVLRAHPQTVEAEILSLLRFIDERPLLKGAYQGMVDECTGFDAQGWIDSKFGHGQIQLPDDDECRALLYRQLLENTLNKKNYIVSITRHLSNGQLAERVEAFTQHFVEPFVRLIDDRLEEGDFLLALLARYRHHVAWFRANELINASGRSGQSESVLDQDLRRALFEMGVDYPFSTPRSPSGEADVVVGSTEPKPIEVKIFDPERNYGVDRLRGGVRQAFDYARDYGLGAGYLVVFNFSEQPLQLPSDRAEQAWPPSLLIAERFVHVIVVDLVQPAESASKRGPVDPIPIERVQLVPDVTE